MEAKEVIQNFWSLRAANTGRLYARVLRGWEEFVKKDILTALAIDALAYIASLKAQSKSDATIRAHFHALRAMYGVLNDMGLTPVNPFRQIARTINKRSKREIRPTKMIPFDKVFRLMSSCDDSLKGLRDRAILACIFGGGLRRSEVHQLDVGDLRANERGIYVLLLRNTKAGVLQEQVLPKWAGRWVNDYLLERTREVPTDPLFTFIHSDGRQRNKRLSVESIYRIYKRHMKKFP